MDQTSPLPEAAADSVESRSTASGARRPRWGVARSLFSRSPWSWSAALIRPRPAFSWPKRFQIFVTAFLSLFIEAAPFLLVGSIVSGIIAVYVMMAVAFILSVCSTVDAFIALAFSSAFTTGSLFGFLVFGLMVDVKSWLLFLGVFRRRTVLYLILLPLALVAVIGVFWNVQVGV